MCKYMPVPLSQKPYHNHARYSSVYVTTSIEIYRNQHEKIHWRTHQEISQSCWHDASTNGRATWCNSENLYSNRTWRFRSTGYCLSQDLSYHQPSHFLIFPLRERQWEGGHKRNHLYYRVAHSCLLFGLESASQRIGAYCGRQVHLDVERMSHREQAHGSTGLCCLLREDTRG